MFVVNSSKAVAFKVVTKCGQKTFRPEDKILAAMEAVNARGSLFKVTSAGEHFHENPFVIIKKAGLTDPRLIDA